MKFLGLTRTSKVPNRQLGKDVLFVDTDGVLKKVEPDTTVSEVGTSGLVAVQSTSVLLDSADLLALDTTPIVLVEGVAEKIIAPFLVMAHYFFGTTEYDDQIGSYSLEVGDFGDSLFGTSISSLLFGTADRLSGLPMLDSLDNADDPELGLGKSFVMGFVGGSIADGDGTLKVNTYYALVDVS